MTFNLSEWAICHRSLVSCLMLVIVGSGAFAYQRLGRSEDPNVTIKTMVVKSLWPGATTNEMASQVTDRIEKALQETPHLDYLRSYTEPGQTIIFVNLREDTPESAIPDAWSQVRNKANDIRPSLPLGTLGPYFDDDFGDTYGIIYAFTADGFTHRELRDNVEQVRSGLLSLPDVAKVMIFGTQDERIYIEFSTERLAGLNLDWASLIQVLQTQNAVTPAGTVQGQNEKILVRVTGEFRSENELRNLNFFAGGRLFRLGDIATVRRAYVDPPQPSFRFNGVPAVGLAVSMLQGGNALAFGANVERAVVRMTADLPVGIEMHRVAEQPQVVKESVNEFMLALAEAIAIVMTVSFLSLGIRAGAVVACSIPLVLAIVFASMILMGIDLQRVSLGALIIALGLLVDDAMITVEMMVRKLEEGLEKARAATFAYTSTAFPMLTGTLVTVAAFIPVGFARSAAGAYTFSLFAVIAVALVASWFVAVLFAPLIGLALLPAKVSGVHRGPGLMMRALRATLIFALRARWLTIGVTLVLFGMAVFGLGFVQQQFFPASDRVELLADLRLADDASIHSTIREVDRFEELLRGDSDIDHWSSYIGQGAIRFYLPLNVQLPSEAFAQTVIVTKSLQARERVRRRLERGLEQQFPMAVARLYPLELGPPVGWPLQWRISGPDPNRLRDLAYRLATVIATHPYPRQINFDWVQPAKTLRVKVNQDQARLLGLSSEAIAQVINTVVTGVTITQVRDGIYLVDVVARAEPEQRVSLATLRNLQVPLGNGRTVPLTQLATLDYGLEQPIIWRRDRQPTLTVQADLKPGIEATTVVDELAPRIAEFQGDLPPGYKVAVGGTVEESRNSQASVAAVVPVMLLLLLMILMVQLQSFQRLFLVMSVAPLGLVGVVAALLLSARPLGFVAILGVIALIGMIVRNSVILIDQIETEVNNGRDRWNAVIAATTDRTRPILLTAAAAILGMVPIAWNVFWGPMAFAIMGGLAVATVLTLVFLPALYVTWFRVAPSPSAACQHEVSRSTAHPQNLTAIQSH
jgi:multidrug efflux pump